MILVDTSIWVELLGRKGAARPAFDTFAQMATCPPVIQEVLQGIREPAAYARVRAGMLALPCVGAPVERETYVEAAELYRSGRRAGLTIRSSWDCLIAAIALRAQLPVWHRDRDFDAIASFTDLRVVRQPP